MTDTITITTALVSSAAPTRPHVEPLEQQRRIGPYRLVDRIGRGGMGVVYHAVHEVTGRVVALKLIDLDDHHLKLHLERVTHEAMTMASLRHPHVVICYSFGEDGRHLYLALELMAGGDTVRLVAQQGGKLDEATIRTLAGACASGLEAIHHAGLVHRDIKPSNILLDEHGVAKLADFGLACFDKPEIGAPGAKAEAGTPAFMPPEAITGECAPDIRGDLYSLGVTMYYWATGASPFSGSNGNAHPAMTLQRVLSGVVVDLRTVRPDLSPELTALIAKAMHRNREQRFQDPQTFLAALRGESPAAPPVAAASAPPAPPARAGVAIQRQQYVAWLAVAIAGLAVALVLLGYTSTTPARGRSPLELAGAADGPAAAALGEGYRLTWLGDGLVRFHENGPVSYTHSGQRVHLADDGWLDGSAAPPLTRLLGASGDLSVELITRPSNLTQEGPARMFCIGLTQRAADLMVGQSGSRIEVRVRTTVTNPDGTRPHLVSDDGVLNGRWQHVVFVRRGTHHLLFVDGRLRAEAEVPGDLGTWDANYPVCVGNDHRGGFPWTGSLDRVVLSARAWSDTEVSARYRAWTAESGDPGPAQ